MPINDKNPSPRVFPFSKGPGAPDFRPFPPDDSSKLRDRWQDVNGFVIFFQEICTRPPCEPEIEARKAGEPEPLSSDPLFDLPVPSLRQAGKLPRQEAFHTTFWAVHYPLAVSNLAQPMKRRFFNGR
jgi:hypothetical protein